jgi:Bacterial Ig-like domain (group 3)
LRIHKVAVATLMSAIAAGSLVAAAAMPAAAGTHSPRVSSATGPNLFGATVTPNKDLVNNQVVKVSVTKVPKGTPTLWTVECSSQITTFDLTYCDQTSADEPTVTPTKTSATINFKIHTGAAFLATHPGSSCVFPRTCYIVVADGTTLTPNLPNTAKNVWFATVSFKDLRPATKTTVASKKAIKVHKSLTIKVATTHAKGTAKPTGTVKITDNGKKIASLKESTTGKLTIKHKFKKAGKQHIKVTYGGDKNYKPSSAKETVTVKK